MKRLLFLSLFLPLLLSAQEYQSPDPAKILPNWWENFEVEGDQLNSRIQKFSTDLKTLKIEIPLEKQENANHLIDRIISNLNSYEDLKGREVDQTLAAWVPKEVYTYKQYVALTENHRATLRKMSYEKLERERIKELLSELEQVIRNRYVHYLEMAGPNIDKFMVGLDLLALKSRWGFLNEELRLVRAQIIQDEKLANRYKEELLLAREKLDFSSIQSGDLKKRIEELQLEYEKATRTLLGAEADAARAADQPSQTKLLRQGVIHALIAQAVIKTDILRIKAVRTLSYISEDIHSEQVLHDLQNWQNYQQMIHQRIQTWRKFSSVERDISSKELILLKGNGDDFDERLVKVEQERNQLATESLVALENLSRLSNQLELTLDLIEDQVVSEQTVLEMTSYRIGEFVESIQGYFTEWIYFGFFDVGGVPITLIGILKAILVVIGAYWISKLTQRGILRYMKRKKDAKQPTFYALSRIIHYLILGFGLLAALSTLGLTTDNIVLILSALGIGVGFGLQTIVNNFLCGVAVLFEQSVKVGDFIELDTGEFGRVEEIHVQNTRMHTFDGIDILIPNSTLFNSKTINWTTNDPYQRLHIPFGVAYGTDQDKVTETVIAVAKKIPSTLIGVKGTRDPEVWLVQFGDSSLNFELVVWVNIFLSSGRSSLKANYMSAIEKALKENGIQIPFPQRDLHLKTIAPNLSEKIKDAKLPNLQK